jgi:hypothetical protein
MTTPERLVALSRTGRDSAVRSPDGVELFRHGGDSDAAVRLSIPGLVDFAVVADELWAVTPDALHRFELSTGREIARVAVRWPGARLVAARTAERSCVVRTTAGDLWASMTSDTLEIEPLAGSERMHFVAPVGGRFVLGGDDGEVRVFQAGNGEGRTVLRLPDGEAAAHGASLHRGELLVVTTVAGDEASLVVVGRNGKILQRVALPTAARRLALVEADSSAVLLLEDGQVLVVDLRFGRTLHALSADPGTHDLEVSADGRVALVAHVDRGGQVVVREIVDDGGAGRRSVPPAAPPPTAKRAEEDRDDDEDDDDVPVAPTVPVRSADELRARSRQLVEDALCHTSLLLERLFFLNRNLGLLPRTSTADDPLGAIVITDADVTTILAGFHKLGATAPEARSALLQDPFAAKVQASRAQLRARLLDDAFADCGLARLVKSFELDAAMTDQLLLALSPDWDLRMGRLFGFLNNDATQTRPRMGHLLMSAEFGMPAPDGKLFRSTMTALFDSGLLSRETIAATPVVAQHVRASDEVVEISMGFVDHHGVSPPRAWSELRWPEKARRHMRRALRLELQRTGDPRVVMLEGLRGSGRLAMAQAAARELGLAVETCDLAQADADEMVGRVRRAALRARAWGRVLVVRSDGALRGGGARLFGPLVTTMTAQGVPSFMLVRPGELEAVDPSVSFVRFEPPRMTRDGRRQLLGEALAASHLVMAPDDMDDIVARFDCPPGRIHELATELRFRRTTTTDAGLELADVRDTLRDLTVQRFGNLAKRYESSVTLDDLLFPRAVVDRVEELVYRLRHRHRVLSGWGFADKAHESYGVSALFVGPPGTGKTAAAAAIANALQIDLYIVDFSSVMSKWVGETEQNLAKIFDEAESSSVALLFDEADALFGKRNANQESATDRYANLSVNYLLQRMESFAGLAILTTNLENAMDEAFSRRITSKVRFPETDQELRVRLWRHMIPRGATYAPDVDLGTLSATHKMQGAHIRRTLTRAAFRVAANGEPSPRLSQADLQWAANAEYDDMGRLAYERGDVESEDEDNVSGRRR